MVIIQWNLNKKSEKIKSYHLHFLYRLSKILLISWRRRSTLAKISHSLSDTRLLIYHRLLWKQNKNKPNIKIKMVKKQKLRTNLMYDVMWKFGHTLQRIWIWVVWTTEMSPMSRTILTQWTHLMAFCQIFGH